MKWECLSSSLCKSLTFCISRCYMYFHGISKPTACSQIGFCDASSRAYAAVVFLKIRTAVDFTRTRVSPLCEQSIPRLELLDALLLSQLLSNVTGSDAEASLGQTSMLHRLQDCALYRMGGVEKEWREFIPNHVNEIRTFMPAGCWFHCPGEQNPVDLPSRGVDFTQSSSSVSWMTAPS